MQLELDGTIIVPTDVERMRPVLPFGVVTSIIFNLAVAVTTLKSRELARDFIETLDLLPVFFCR